MMSNAALSTGEAVVPGTVLGSTDHFLSGDATFVRNENIISSVVGWLEIENPSKDASNGNTTTEETSVKPYLKVKRRKQQGIVPKIGDQVTVRITKVDARMASCEIVCVGTTVLREPFPGAIRIQDVRALEKDSVEIYKSFRPGDIVVASVISLGDSRKFLLSTAQDHLGVVLARSAAGHIMIPVSWQQMQCPNSKALEFRKVAKVVDNNTK